MTSLHGPVARVLGKIFPISASMGSIFTLSSRPSGDLTLRNSWMRFAISSSEPTPSAICIRRSEPNWLIRTFAPGCPLTFSKSSAWPPAGRPPVCLALETRSVISVISRTGSTSAETRFSSRLRSSSAIHSLRSV